MMSFVQKLFAVLLIILVGLAPLQSAFAGLEDAIWQIDSTVEVSTSMDMDTDHDMNADCDQCTTENCCNGQDCALSHCATFVPVIVLETLPAYGQFAGLAGDIRHGFAPIHASSPFRPPIS